MQTLLILTLSHLDVIWFCIRHPSVVVVLVGLQPSRINIQDFLRRF